ncbi:hypothetical protein DY000_02009204 [Brassica cretica]|uniref:C-CAP/cofactor C-like domain-containing protein n=1 Tax=Brassica cretica TaxID=69181 RepID=A0ABQ7C6A7_BRACR|nr:hypothetical protein DY000_02009204 [Brassica cretica]
MEDDDRSFATETLDEALQKKHHDMLQRFSARHHGRKSDSPHSPSSSTFESTSSFLSRFADSKRSIESRIGSRRDLIIDRRSREPRGSQLLLPPLLRDSIISQIRIGSQTESPNVAVVRDSPGFRNKHGETLSKSFKSSSCQVKLIGAVNALFVHGLRNWSVYAGPVIGSILIDDVEDSVFVMASHQIRIHRAKKCDLYLSRPIIEDSNGIRFAPYSLDYEGIEEDLKTEEETESWANVDDFLWLRAVHSPNWSVLPEEERLSLVSISSDGHS